MKKYIPLRKLKKSEVLEELKNNHNISDDQVEIYGIGKLKKFLNFCRNNNVNKGEKIIEVKNEIVIIENNKIINEIIPEKIIEIPEKIIPKIKEPLHKDTEQVFIDKLLLHLKGKFIKDEEYFIDNIVTGFKKYWNEEIDIEELRKYCGVKYVKDIFKNYKDFLIDEDSF